MPELIALEYKAAAAEVAGRDYSNEAAAHTTVAEHGSAGSGAGKHTVASRVRRKRALTKSSDTGGASQPLLPHFTPKPSDYRMWCASGFGLVLDDDGWITAFEGSEASSPKAQGCVIGSRIVAVCNIAMTLVMQQLKSGYRTISEKEKQTP